jgi:hypothetical protein
MFSAELNLSDNIQQRLKLCGGLSILPICFDFVDQLFVVSKLGRRDRSVIPWNSLPNSGAMGS